MLRMQAVIGHKKRAERPFSLALTTVFRTHLTAAETATLREISGWLTTLDTAVHRIWKEQTETRFIDDERLLPLSSMAIIIINQCAVNMTECLHNIQSTFPMRALFVSSCIGWTIFWKQTLQGPTTTPRHMAYIKAAWEAITDLHTTFKRILKLVALARHRHKHPSSDVVESSGEWISSSG